MKNILIFKEKVIKLLIFIIVFNMLLNISNVLAESNITNFQPNEEIQEFIKSFLSLNEKEIFSGTEEQFKSKLVTLEKMLYRNHEDLIAQLLYFSMNTKNTREAMLAGIIIKQLNISKHKIALGLIPLLDTKNELLIKKEYNWLGEVDSIHTKEKHDFSEYELIIKERKSKIPKGLIRYMYQKNPELAISSMASVFLEKTDAEKLIQEMDKNDSIIVLDLLSKRKEWWVHYYIAKKIQNNSKLLNNNLSKILNEDSNPLVQEIISEISNKEQK